MRGVTQSFAQDDGCIVPAIPWDATSMMQGHKVSCYLSICTLVWPGSNPPMQHHYHSPEAPSTYLEPAQEAAGVFGYLRDGPALKVEPPRPTDLTPECCHMLERLCLAQAQEAAFDKARADGKGPVTLGRCASPRRSSGVGVGWGVYCDCWSTSPLVPAWLGAWGAEAAKQRLEGGRSPYR